MNYNVTFDTMLQVLHKILAIIIALVVLFSSLSFTVEKHVCMGQVTDTSYFAKADNCGMISDECDVNNSLETKIKKEKCCNNIQELFPGNQNEQQALQNFEINKVQFALAFNFTYLDLFKQKNEFIPFIEYSPPLVGKDIIVLYQNFLI